MDQHLELANGMKENDEWEQTRDISLEQLKNKELHHYIHESQPENKYTRRTDNVKQLHQRKLHKTEIVSHWKHTCIMQISR